MFKMTKGEIELLQIINHNFNEAEQNRFDELTVNLGLNIDSGRFYKSLTNN
jgi:hypothetical protein